MPLIAALTGLATRIGTVIDGPRNYVFNVLDLLAAVAELHPGIVLLDVQLGASAHRAVEAIPEIMRRSPLTVVIVVTRRPTAGEVEELRGLGAYGWVDCMRDDFPLRIREAATLAEVAAEVRRTKVRAKAAH